MFVACKQTKYVPEGKYLLKKNKIEVQGGKLNEDDVAEIIRQKPNYKTLGLKVRLAAYNMVDSVKVAEKRARKNEQIREDNKERIAKQDRINQKRIDEARAKGEVLYTQKIIPLKDTVMPRKFFREWLKYKVGEKPVIFDSVPYQKTLSQLNIYLNHKGYYYGNVVGKVDTLEKQRKVVVTYTLTTGPQYFIDSVTFKSDNESVIGSYQMFLKKQQEEPLIGQAFDKDYLNQYRSRVAKFMRDNALYGFSSSHINYVADTSKLGNMKVHLEIEFNDRMVPSDFDKDSLIPIKHRVTTVRQVYFHIADSIYCEGDFYKTIKDRGLTLMDGQFLRTIDTFHYAKIKDKSGNLEEKRKATFYYNCELFIDPGLIELQNYLEKDNYYKEYYLERSYTRLLQLELFNVIKPQLIENYKTSQVDAHYYLEPAQRQSFGFEPRMTNSNGFLGLASSINYTNKNLFGGGQKMVLSIGGGFESQPPVFDKTEDGDKIKKAGRSFNTFEIGPSIKFDIPGLFPTKPTILGKRSRPRTVISTAYNFQSRTDFVRHNFQLNYLWKFYVAKTQIIQIGLPGASVVKFVRISKSPEFESLLVQLNDLFLINSYSNQLIWEDLKGTFEYNNKEKDDKKTKLAFYLNSTADLAGNILSAFKSSQQMDTFGHYQIFGVNYSQFFRWDNDLTISRPFTSKRSINGRLQAGFGIPYGNSSTSLPYDYGFFAGGANDNRGWRARALGPGSYKYYLDPNRTATQIGDVRLGSSLEYRFSLGGIFKGAVFTDAGNVWTYNFDNNRLGSQFEFKRFYKEIALSAGVGLRMDLDFFIFRLDFGIPLTNPALPKGEKWIFQDRPQFYAEALDVFGPDYADVLVKPFIPNIHFGIGYPF